jgi:hypothetical protein
MKKLLGRNTMAKRIAPGIWQDADGNVHFSVPEMMKQSGIENTPENLKECMELCRQVAERDGIKPIMRLKPED